MDKRLEEIADMLFDIGAIKFGAFKLKLHEKHPDAPLSPIYLNLRTPDNPKPGPLTPEIINLIIEFLYERACTFGLVYEQVAGVPNAGNPLAAAFAELSGKPLLRLFKTGSGDNRKVAGIEGIDYRPGELVLVIDDLITKADSKLEAIEVLKYAGLYVKNVVFIVDRGQGGADELCKKGYSTTCCFTLCMLLDYYVNTGRISIKKFKEVMAYVQNN
jgi:uridine monophosphate synthetase